MSILYAFLSLRVTWRISQKTAGKSLKHLIAEQGREPLFIPAQVDPFGWAFRNRKVFGMKPNSCSLGLCSYCSVYIEVECFQWTHLPAGR